MRANVGKIVNLMCEKKINQGQLAKGCGVNVSTVSAIMKGRSNPTLKTINKMALFLGCEPGEIVEREA